MAVSIDEFKKAFAGNESGDDLKARDRSFAKALTTLDKSIETLEATEVGGGLRSDREELVKQYRAAREQTGRSTSEIASQLDEIQSQIETVIARTDAVPADSAGAGAAPPPPTDTEWSISPDGQPPTSTPGFGAPGKYDLGPWYLEQLKKEREQREKETQEACRKARKWLEGLSRDEVRKLSYPGILAAIKQKFPAVSDLPKPRMLMEMVDDVLKDYLRDQMLFGDSPKLAMEKLIAGYIAALPGSINAIVSDGGIRLVMTGSAGAPAAGDDGKPGDKKTEKFEFKNKDYTIQVTSEAWQALDPTMRAKWRSLNDEATALEKLWDKLSSLKKEWESEKDGTSSKVELEARIKDLEAEFKWRWETLQKSIDATVKATTDGIKATLTEAKKKVKDEKVGAELELKFEEMSVGLKAFAATPDLKTALAITGSAETITAKIEAEAIKSGTVVTLAYEKALKEVKEQLELQVKQGKASVAATLSKEAVKLEEKLKEFQNAKAKDFKDVQTLEEGLEKLQLEVKAEFTAGNFKVSAGGKVADTGEVGGKVKVEMMLEEGISFFGEGQKISFSADVSKTGYKFALMFSVGDMPDLADVHKANQEADEKIRKLYDLVQDADIRSMDDAKKIQKAFSEVMKPLKKSVESMKKVDKKKVAAEFGITVTGDLPSGGRMPPPVLGFGVTVRF